MPDAATTDRTIDAAALRPARALLFLATAVLSLMTVAPLLWMVSMAFKDSGEVFGTNLVPHRPTLDNLLYVFTKVDFFRFLLNTFVVSATVTLVALFFHSMAGYALARLRFPGREVIFLAMFSTFLILLPG